uniref:Meiosis-specific nuclear structural protein 1 n=1 Tax=Junco hyemalis TaxID=40217 RepID=A0A8C5JLF9_JUNHY
MGSGSRGCPAPPPLPCCPQASEEREWGRRAARLRAELERERRLDEELRAAEESRKQRALQLEREQKLAAELARRDLEKTRDEKIRQQVRANSLELRELESKLKSAYMNKERAAQIAEKKAIHSENMKWEDEVAQAMKEDYDRYLKEEMSAELKRNQEKKTYQQELDKQVEEQEKKKQEAYEEFLREKHMIDEIVKKIYEEEQIKKQRKLDKIRETQTYIEEFIKEQAIWRKRKQEEMEEENRKIMEFANMQRQREDDWMAKVRDSEEKKQRVQNMLAKTMEREEQRRKEREQILQDLYMEEQEAMERKKEMAEIEKRIRQRLDLRQAYEKQVALKAAEEEARREEDRALQQQILAQLAEEDRIKQLNAQKWRMKQLEHKMAVEKILEDRRKQGIAEKERELEERELEKKRQERIRAIIEEERQKLLKEHAWKLLGYLPRVCELYFKYLYLNTLNTCPCAVLTLFTPVSKRMQLNVVFWQKKRGHRL